MAEKKRKASRKATKKASKKATKKAAKKSGKKAGPQKAPARKKAARKAAKKTSRKAAGKASKKASRKASKKKSARKSASGKTTRKKTAQKKAGKKPARKPASRAKAAKKPARKPAGRGKRDAAFYERFRKRLLEERQRITTRLDELREELAGLDETPRELEEWAQEEKDRDILIRLEERETDELRRIQAALQLIDQREYGTCQSCGKPIPIARLEELPTAFRCVDCMS